MSVLARAEMLLQAKNYSGSGNWLDEANSHDAVNSGALFLSYTGTQYLHLPGTNGNNMDTPSTAALNMAGTDAVFEVDVTLDDVAKVGHQGLMIKDGTAGNTRSWLWLIESVTANLRFLLFDDAGGVEKQFVSTVALSTVKNDGDDAVIRADLDIDDGAGGSVCKFYVDGVQLGADVTHIAVLAGNPDGTGIMEIGGRVGSEPFIGSIRRATLYSDLARTTTVFDADLTDASAVTEPFATFTEASSTAATVTINRSADGRVSTVVDRPMFLLADNDSFTIADHANLNFGATDDMTVMFAGRLYHLPPTDDYGEITKYARVAAPGWYIDVDVADSALEANVRTLAESTKAFTVEPSVGVAYIHAQVRNTTDDDLTGFLDGSAGTPVTDVTTTSLANALDVRIGTYDDDVIYADFEVHAVVLWREALSDADIAIAGDELDGIFAETVTRRVISSPRYGITRMASR